MRRLLWLPVVAVLVLAARWLCYALAAPSPLSANARGLGRRAAARSS